MFTKYTVVKNDKLNPQTQTILNEYLENMKLVNRSELTIKRYQGLLERVLGDIAKPIEKLEAQDIRDYILSNFSNFKECTINSYISILSSFFKFCLIEEYIDKPLIKNRWRPDVPKSLPRYLDKIELAKVKLESEKLSLRNRTIFEFLLSSGCRVAEAQGLNVKDIDLKSRTARVLGKGNKIRDIHFSETCSLLLEEYIEEHPKIVDALFLNRYNKRLSIRTLQRIVESLGKKANLMDRIGPHLLRHTFATTLLTKGASLEFIADELGHADSNTTRIYARLPQDQVVELYRKYMG